MMTRAPNAEPLRLITGETVGGDPAREFWLLVGVLAILFLVSTLGAMFLWWRRTVTIDAGDFAFRTLARKLGVARHDRSVVRRLAQLRGYAPAALLVSPSALRDAIETCRHNKEANLDRASLDRLMERLAPA